MFRKEEVVTFKPGRKFKGASLSRNVFESFDEVKYRVWHQSKENELLKFSKYKATYQEY